MEPLKCVHALTLDRVNGVSYVYIYLNIIAVIVDLLYTYVVFWRSNQPILSLYLPIACAKKKMENVRGRDVRYYAHY